MGGSPGPEGPRAPSRRSAPGGPGLPGLPRPDLARAPSQPVLLTPVSGTHDLAIAAPLKSREEWSAVEVDTIETRKSEALDPGAGRGGHRKRRSVMLLPGLRSPTLPERLRSSTLGLLAFQAKLLAVNTSAPKERRPARWRRVPVVYVWVWWRGSGKPAGSRDPRWQPGKG